MDIKEIKTIPNLITLVRLMLIPVIIFFLFKGNLNYALILMTIAFLSDELDGYIARKFKQETNLGKILDAAADTTLIFITIFMLYYLKYVSLILLFLITLPRIITFIVIRVYHKNNFFTGIYAKIAATFSYFLLIFILLKLNGLIIYTIIAIVWVLSFLHWSYIKNKK